MLCRFDYLLLRGSEGWKSLGVVLCITGVSDTLPGQHSPQGNLAVLVAGLHGVSRIADWWHCLQTEALFADLGHFSRHAIQISTFCLLWPSLMLTYLGQAAYLTKQVTLSMLPFCSMQCAS